MSVLLQEFEWSLRDPDLSTVALFYQDLPSINNYLDQPVLLTADQNNQITLNFPTGFPGEKMRVSYRQDDLITGRDIIGAIATIMQMELTEDDLRKMLELSRDDSVSYGKLVEQLPLEIRDYLMAPAGDKIRYYHLLGNNFLFGGLSRVLANGYPIPGEYEVIVLE